MSREANLRMGRQRDLAASAQLRQTISKRACRLHEQVDGLQDHRSLALDAKTRRQNDTSVESSKRINGSESAETLTCRNGNFFRCGHPGLRRSDEILRLA